MNDSFKRITQLLKNPARILCITGAGISADSGLPTYRGVSGLYESACTDEGIPIETALSGPMFRRQPELTWKYIHQLEKSCRGAFPNAGHTALRELEERGHHVCILTQNVDGLHERAGSENVIAIHGRLHEVGCCDCDYNDAAADYEKLPALPRCPLCDGIVRPRIILFGEALPEKQLITLHQEMALGFDVVLSVGTTSLFPYILEPMLRARSWGALSVEVNPEETPATLVSDVVFRDSAAAWFETLLGKLRED